MSAHKSDSNSTTAWTRREFLGTGMAAGAALAAGSGRDLPADTGAAAEGGAFPKGFLWGAATAAHQVEGNNINSDLWVLEHVKPTLFDEPSARRLRSLSPLSGRHPRCWPRLGLNTYRFSIEWARIEPEQGYFSNAALDHYRRVLAACHEQGLFPMVTFYHFSSPRWFAALGGWEKPAGADLFVRYCERAARHLGDLIGAATTFNEPNLPDAAALDAPACRYSVHHRAADAQAGGARGWIGSLRLLLPGRCARSCRTP